MTFTTRLSEFFTSYIVYLQDRLLYVQKQFTGLLCLLFIGFLIGNLFGTFLNLIREFLVWDGLIGIFLVAVMEIFSYAAYHDKERSFGVFLIHPKTLNRLSKSKQIGKIGESKFWQKLNLFKIGLMIGFFVDAFKVGS